MKRQKRKWSRTEGSLFAAPFLLLLLVWFFNSHKAPDLRRLVALSPAPTATPTPVPTPTTPRKIREARLIYQVLPSPDGRTLWTLNHLNGKRSVHQFSLAANVWMRAVDGAEDMYGGALKIAPDDRSLIYGWSGKKGEYAEIFDTTTAKSRLRLPVDSGTPSVAISPDSRFFALGYDGYFEIRAVNNARLLHRIHWQSGLQADFLRDACFSRDGKSFAVSDGVIGVFSTQSWRPVARYCPPRSQVVTFAFAGKNQLAVRSQDKTQLNMKSAVWLYNFQSRKVRWLRTLESSGGYSLAISPDERFVAISDFVDPTGIIVEIYDVNQAFKIAAGQIPDEEFIPSIAFSSDNQSLFIGGENAKIRRWPKTKWNLNYPDPL